LVQIAQGRTRGRYGVLGAGEYVEEHWFFWAGMATISGVGACLGWIRKVS